MQLQYPFRTVTPTVDGEVLRVLARSEEWFTAPRITALVGSHSAQGVRLVLHRLLEQGVVERQPAGRASLYRLNRDHLAARAITDIAHLSRQLRTRMREDLEQFRTMPRYAMLFGSAARGEMRVDSDIDLMLVRDQDVDEAWEEDVATFTHHVYRWTGNDPRVVDYKRNDILRAADDEPLLRSVADEGVALIGSAASFRKDVLAP